MLAREGENMNGQLLITDKDCGQEKIKMINEIGTIKKLRILDSALQG